MNYLLSETDFQYYGNISTCVIQEDSSSCLFDNMISIDSNFTTYLSPPEVPTSLPPRLEINPSNEFEFRFYGKKSSHYFHQDQYYSSYVSAFKPNEDSRTLDLHPKSYEAQSYLSSETMFQYFGENLSCILYGDNYICTLFGGNLSCSFMGR